MIPKLKQGEKLSLKKRNGMKCNRGEYYSSQDQQSSALATIGQIPMWWIAEPGIHI